jgi:hypothetical protein
MMFTRRLLPIATALILTCGCSDITLQDVDGPPSPQHTRPTIEVTSADPARPHFVDFGDLPTGEVAVAEVHITNMGEDTLQLQDFVLSDSAVTRLELEPSNLLLEHNEETTLRVGFHPIADGLLSSQLLIYSNDPQTPVVVVELRGDALGGHLVIDPPSFDFGDLEIGCSSELTVVLSNDGRADLVIESVELEQLSEPEEVFLLDPTGGPVVLPPGQSLSVDLHYIPTDVIPDTSILRVFSDDAGSPEQGSTVTQIGTAHYGGTATDDFYQGGLGLTDILFVVDNSCSMIDEQTTFAANFPGFVPILEANDTDYKLAATTTDAGDNGAFVGSVPVVTPATPDPGATFASNVVLGTSGSGFEQAMLGGWLALDPVNNMNPGFLRPSAELHIILITDAVDFSVAAGMPFLTPAEYVEGYRSLKENPDLVVVHDISGQAEGCTGLGGNAQPNSTVSVASALTGGVSASICDPNWVESLEAISTLATAVADTFPLSELAIPDTIEVYLNGSSVFDGWSYEETANAVIFNGSYIPDKGDEVTINYSVFGGCDG